MKAPIRLKADNKKSRIDGCVAKRHLKSRSEFWNGIKAVGLQLLDGLLNGSNRTQQARHSSRTVYEHLACAFRNTGLSVHLAPILDSPTYRLLALKPQQTIYLVLR